LFDQTIEVGYGELRALQPHEKELLMFSKTELTKFESNGKTIALSNGDKILGFSVGRIVEAGYTLEVYDTDWEKTHPGKTPKWPEGEPQTPPPQRYYAAPLAANVPSGGGLTGTAGNSGASWLEASSDIQKLVEAARLSYAVLNAPVEIWVAAGTYTAESGTGTVISIDGTEVIHIYGGFLGNETAPIGELTAGRANWFNTYATLALGNTYGTAKDASHKTILDADGSGTPVIVKNVTDFALDGFTITNGSKGGLEILNAPATFRLFTNLELTGNDTTGGGGGIIVRGGAPRLDKLTITNNTATGDWGGGIYIRKDDGTGIGSTALVTNVLISGNEATADNGRGILAMTGDMVIANALVAGNRMVITNSNMATEFTLAKVGGGGGIKVGYGNHLTLINSTVSGNYVSRYDKGYPSNQNLWGGGIMVDSRTNGTQPGSLSLYNCLVLGNTGKPGEDDDITLSGQGRPPHGNTTYTAFNSMVGGISKTVLDNGFTLSGVVPGITNAGCEILPGANNTDGTAYGAAALPLTGLKTFFAAFPALPTELNTGHNGYNAALWDFRLNNPPAGIVNGGEAAHYALLPGGVPTDVSGAARVQGGDPDMGAYEK
jgi:hypothetical protein